MDYSVDLAKSLTRNPHFFYGAMKKTDDGRIVTTKPIVVMFPEQYINKSLCDINEEIYCLGIFAFISPETKDYAVMNIPARVSMPIGQMETVTNNDNKYRVVHYDKGDTVITNTNVIQDDKLAYWIFDYFIALAYIPWYMTYNDILTIYDKDGHYAGRWLRPSSQIVEMLIGNVAHDPEDHRKMYRATLKSLSDIETRPPEWIALKNITLGAVDTYSRIMGSYFDEGLTSSLATPSQEITRIEEVLRK